MGIDVPSPAELTTEPDVSVTNTTSAESSKPVDTSEAQKIVTDIKTDFAQNPDKAVAEIADIQQKKDVVLDISDKEISEEILRYEDSRANAIRSGIFMRSNTPKTITSEQARQRIEQRKIEVEEVARIQAEKDAKSIADAEAKGIREEAIREEMRKYELDYPGNARYDALWARKNPKTISVEQAATRLEARAKVKAEEQAHKEAAGAKKQADEAQRLERIRLNQESQDRVKTEKEAADTRAKILDAERQERLRLEQEAQVRARAEAEVRANIEREARTAKE